MKAKKETRIFCVLLIFSLLFGLCSCYKTEEEYDPSLRIEIEAGEIVYGEEFLENANARFANIVVYLLESYLGSILSEARKEALSTAFSSEAAPLFMKAGIYESEVSAILSEAEKCVMLSAAEGFSPAILFPYTNAVFIRLDPCAAAALPILRPRDFFRIGSLRRKRDMSNTECPGILRMRSA